MTVSISLDPVTIGVANRYCVSRHGFSCQPSTLSTSASLRKVWLILPRPARFEYTNRDVPALLLAVWALLGPIRNPRRPPIAASEAGFFTHASIINFFRLTAH